MGKGVMLFAGCALLAGCGGHEQSSGGVTAEESRQLNEAAAMLDAAPNVIAPDDDEGDGEEVAVNMD